MAFSSPVKFWGEKAILSNRLGVDGRIKLSGVQSPETTHEIGQNRSVENSVFLPLGWDRALTINKNGEQKMSLFSEQTGTAVNGPKMIQACKHGDIKTVLSLADEVDVVNFRDNTGWCPIHYAAQNGNGKILRVLANSDADLDAKTGDGYTAGHLLISYFKGVWKLYEQRKIPQEQIIALMQSTFACFQTLVNFQADLTIPAPDGTTVRDFLQKIGTWHQR